MTNTEVVWVHPDCHSYHGRSWSVHLYTRLELPDQLGMLRQGQICFQTISGTPSQLAKSSHHTDSGTPSTSHLSWEDLASPSKRWDRHTSHGSIPWPGNDGDKRRKQVHTLSCPVLYWYIQQIISHQCDSGTPRSTVIPKGKQVESPHSD